MTTLNAETAFTGQIPNLELEMDSDNCTSTCCAKRVPLLLGADFASSSFVPQIKDRIGIYETMQYLPEVFYAGSRSVQKLTHTLLTPNIVPCLKAGAIILVETERLGEFFTKMHPMLQMPYVLLSMNTDLSAPFGVGTLLGMGGRFVEKFVRNNTLLLHWYAANCDVHAESIDKFTCMPIGFAHNNDQKHVMEKVLAKIPGLSYRHGQPRFPQDIEENRKGLALASYQIGAKPKEPRTWGPKSRVMAQALAAKYWERTNLTHHMCSDEMTQQLWKDEDVACKNFESIREVYDLSLQYKFMLSPRGVGLDCYRTWEALYLGMIPVVKTSTLDSMYQGLPVLIVDEWSDLTPELLHGVW
eukprot:CAMPEP_0183725922 /NCGR_PEP_ID=MMETSP0737-20130205/21903_1 /TAXON_ID=385413 /ORGANISM="Thalassiosira miniscula, Strain CCMP1093" /LENGTH=356 /DNA_ID=CAMNT_0025957093 /DNA_START=32 /DNA_END=1099 /DNA_ORIENTATION=-